MRCNRRRQQKPCFERERERERERKRERAREKDEMRNVVAASENRSPLPPLPEEEMEIGDVFAADCYRN
jgi:hypothetical protein